LTIAVRRSQLAAPAFFMAVEAQFDLRAIGVVSEQLPLARDVGCPQFVGPARRAPSTLDIG